MYLYECILTLNSEVRYFWTGNMTGATIVFCLNKYLNMFYTIYSIAVSPDRSYPQVSKTVQAFTARC